MGSSGINAEYMGHLLSSTQPAMKTFVALAALSSVLALAFADGSDFADCAGKDNSEYVSQYTLNIKPDPIVAKKDAQVAIHFNADVIKAFPEGTTLDFKMVKENVALPCMPLPDLPFPVGSCTYQAQQLLDVVPDDLWAQFAPAGQSKSLPLNPGKYGDFDATGAITLTIPDIPDIIKPLIRGDINGGNILCADDTLHVTAP